MYLPCRFIGLLLVFTPLLFSCSMATAKVLLWPEIQGQILNAGKPVAGLKLTQTLFWNYEESKAPPRVVTLKTDTDGRFVFPKISGEISTGFMTRLLYQPGIVMEIKTTHAGKPYSVNISSSLSHFGESEPPEQLECDLQRSELFEGVYLVECTRNTIPAMTFTPTPASP
ncbi:DUF4198 domain-containing protein [Limnobacter humi]|uniref:DUF4198 domain-containing protein n=1 Tax=Limnobacter humi TaxID=1778671 RepID=A0ABT1WHQ0_9BURK|nr:DUF4198 domain-containing protein [Limnobacter humi]MCQ8896939.1 DUF4198 domain-containing protein [Limnobacter humi]